MRKPFKSLSLAVVLLAGVGATDAVVMAGGAGGSASLGAASISSYMVSAVVAGSAYVIHSGAKLVVESVKPIGQSLLITLKSPVDLSVATIKLSASAVGASSVGVGESIQVVSDSAGQLLIHSGKLLAVIPNKVGESLLHQSAH